MSQPRPCGTCKVTKPIEEFYRTNRTTCIACMKLRVYADRKANPEKWKADHAAQTKRYRARHRRRLCAASAARYKANAAAVRAENLKRYHRGKDRGQGTLPLD